MDEVTFDPSAAASRLELAWRTGQMLKFLPFDERPSSLAEGYSVQAAMIDRLDEGIAGWKVAGATPRGLRGELPRAPIIGCLIPSRVYPSEAVLRIPPGAKMTIEAEVAFSFARTVSPADEVFNPSSMIERAFVAIEVVCSRFVDRKLVDQASFVADNAGFHAFICGAAVEFDEGASFGDDAGLWWNGERIAESLNGDDRTRPFQSLDFLWGELGRQGKTISKGAMVTTGTLCVPFETSRPGRYEARLGNASVVLTLA